jgi:hypothetical protein
MTYSFPTREAATEYLTKNGWTYTRNDHFTKPSVRGDNAAIPMLAIAFLQHNVVAPEYNKPDYFTVEFI